MCGRSLAAVSPSVLPHFTKAAEEMMKDTPAVDILARALAYMSGYKDIVARSLLSSQQVSQLAGLSHHNSGHMTSRSLQLSIPVPQTKG